MRLSAPDLEAVAEGQSEDSPIWRLPLKQGHHLTPEARVIKMNLFLEEFSREHGLTFITVAQLVAYRLKHERLVHRVAEARLPTDHGQWRIVGYRNDTPFAVGRLLRDALSGPLMIANERIHQTNAGLLLVAKDV